MCVCARELNQSNDPEPLYITTGGQQTHQCTNKIKYMHTCAQQKQQQIQAEALERRTDGQTDRRPGLALEWSRVEWSRVEWSGAKRLEIEDANACS